MRESIGNTVVFGMTEILIDPAQSRAHRDVTFFIGGGVSFVKADVGAISAEDGAE
jgi:hypothetical protein